MNELYEVLSFVDEHYFRHGNEWIAGESITIADFAYASLIAGLTVSSNAFDEFNNVELKPL